MVKDGVDAHLGRGCVVAPYAIPNLLVELHSPKIGVPVQWWRSVGSTHTAFSTETFIDELAVAAGKDPVAFRKTLLAAKPAPSRRAETRDGQSRLGHAAGARARPAKSAVAASPCTSRSIPLLRKSPK